MRVVLLTIVIMISNLVQSQVGTYKVIFEFEIVAKEKNPDLSMLSQVLKGDQVTCYIGKDGLKAVLTNEDKNVSTFVYDSKDGILYENQEGRKYGIKHLASKQVKTEIKKTGKYDIVADKRCYIGIHGAEPETELKFSPEVQSMFDLPFYSHSDINSFWLVVTERQLIIEKTYEFPTFYVIQRVTDIIPQEFDKTQFELSDIEYFFSQESVDKQFELQDPAGTFTCLFQKIKKPQELNQEMTAYIEFILTKEGAIRYASSYNALPYDLHKKCLKAFTKCKPQLYAATIGQHAVSSLCYFPIKIRPEKKQYNSE